MNYGNCLKELREEQNLTQQNVADILKISRGLYSQYEIEDKIIPLQLLNILCNYFHVSIDYFFGLSKNKNYYDTSINLDKDTFSLRLKEFRKENKITQTTLADLLNTSHSVISAYESKKTFILTSFLYDICKNYRISADYLVGKIDKPKYLK